MRSGIKFYVASLVMVGLMLGAIVSPSYAAVEAVNDTTWTTWPSTIYYMAHLSGPDAPYTKDITIHITAVDEYTLYVNGNKVGTDNNWKTVETYKVNVNSDDVILGVQVNNKGTGLGNGLMVDIQAGADWLGTTTLKRRSAVVNDTRKMYPCLWYYYTGDITKASFGGADWYKLKYNASKHETFLNDTGVQAQLGQCISGSMELDYRPDPHIEIITGYPGNVDLGSSANGGIQLRRIDGENIAFGRPAQEDRITDGDPTATFFSYNQDPLGTWRYVDLERMYRINRFVLYTGGQDPNQWAEKSVRGFAVDISLDKFRWEEVNVIHEVGITNADEGGYDYAVVDFPDEWARYARFRITEPRDQPPNIGEIMIYGVGYAYSGEYESGWEDFGLTNIQKNFKTIEWEGSTPEGTSITIQLKTAYRNSEGTLIESPWSDLYTKKIIEIESSEPASMIKYKIKLTTQDINRTPVFNTISFKYSKDNQPISVADGYVIPNKVPMGVDANFVYSLSYKLNTAENIKSVAIATPGYASITKVFGTDGKKEFTVDNGGLKALKQTSPDTLWIEFTTPVTDSDAKGPDSLYFSFSTKLLRNIHNFNTWVYSSKNNDDAGPLGVWENKDLGSWTVLTSTITKGVLADVKAVPKVFTPNNDGVNDFTVIEFSLSKIAADIKIKIFDTKGSLVTTVLDKTLEPAPWYVKDKLGNLAGAKNMPGYWDGTDEDGDLVPPGVYIYQVVADTDDGEKVESGTVVVGY